MFARFRNAWSAVIAHCQYPAVDWYWEECAEDEADWEPPSFLELARVYVRALVARAPKAAPPVVRNVELEEELLAKIAPYLVTEPFKETRP